MGSVTNLSSHILTEPEHDLLALGLSLIPTNHKLPITCIQTAMNRLTRALKLKDFFGDSEAFDPIAFKARFMGPSEWTRNTEDITDNTNTIIHKIQTSPAKILHQYRSHKGYIYTKDTKPNLTFAIRQALYSLKNNNKIVIKPADKGAMTCIMDKTAHVTEAHRQLHQPMYYKKISQPRKQILCAPLNHA